MTEVTLRSGRLVRRWPTALGIAVVVALVLTGLFDRFAGGLVWAAVIYLVWGVFRGSYQNRSWLIAEVVGVLLFGAASVAAVLAEDRTAQILLAFGWIAHMAWDVWHHRADAVVPRWWAEQCAVVDVLTAALLLANAV
ncbi:hypothetical protein [Actinoplanes sp. NPDC049802]|uniref:hypothetical protein n=1 Tax=Actinoplanes sp. NPDC049802 TaxID=3154742 RepID=UPI0033D84B5E